MSHQQNPSPTVLQQTTSQADVKPFSIRQYVLASRHKNIIHSWPFHHKYLQMCLKHGLKDVLPPFESLQGCSNNVHSRNHDTKDLAAFCKTELVQQNIKNECDLLSRGEGSNKVTKECNSSLVKKNQLHNCNASVNLSESDNHTFNLPSSIHVHKTLQSLVSSKAMKDKRKRRKCKKRSMVDILAVARHCTLQEIYRINKF